LVQDAQRHGVTVLPVDVLNSDWESTVVPVFPQVGAGNTAVGAVRLGLHQIKGVHGAAAQRIVMARKERAFVDLADLACARRARSVAIWMRLADAGALRSHRRSPPPGRMAGGRRAAGSATCFAGMAVREAPVEFDSRRAKARRSSPTTGSLSLTLGRHPLALLRERLLTRRIFG
jgi:error-prone DNA polymerase